MTQHDVAPLPDFIKRDPDGLVIRIVAAPRAKRSRFVGFHGGVPRVAVAAPASKGRANEELVRFLAELLQVPRQSVQLLRGESSKYKSILIHGASREKVVCAFIVT